VGVNTFILSAIGWKRRAGICDPSNVVNVAFRQLRKFGHVHRAGNWNWNPNDLRQVWAAALSLPRTYGWSSPTCLCAGRHGRSGQACRFGDVLAGPSTGRAADSPLRWWHFISICSRRETKSISTSCAERGPVGIRCPRDGAAARVWTRFTALADAEEKPCADTGDSRVGD